MADMIERGEVLGLLERMQTETLSHGEMQGISKAYQRIKRLPTVEPMQWIPCAVRLPEEDVNVLVCTKPYGQIRRIYVAWLHGERIGEAGLYEPQWNNNSFDNTERCKVVAWMPLPAPYKGGDADAH